MDKLDIDRQILDMIYSDDVKEEYEDMVIEDMMQEIEDMEEGELWKE